MPQRPCHLRLQPARPCCDEAGGLYDHVGPSQEVLPDGIAPILKSGDIQGTFNVSGMRVPLMVMSPYVKPHLVSHTNRDLTSILKFIEKTFNVSSLTARRSLEYAARCQHTAGKSPFCPLESPYHVQRIPPA